MSRHGFVVVSGPPASGKTTLARSLAPELELPLISKDTIKEALMATLNVPDVETSTLLGRAATAALYSLAREIGYGVLENAWNRRLAAPELRRLNGPLVEVFACCDREVAALRYQTRAPSRDPGHFASERRPSDIWNDDVALPVAGGWPVLEVDTMHDVDIRQLAQTVRSAWPSP